MGSPKAKAAAYWQKYRATRSPYVVRLCQQCGVEYRPRATQKRCNACRVRACVGCGIQFTPANGREQACSRSCAAKADPERTRRINQSRGVKPRTYHLRHRDKHGSAFDRDWRTAVFRRDNYTCQDCGVVGGRLNAHHVKPFKSHPELRHVLGNGLTLCVPCHKKTDTYGWANYWKNEIAAKRLSQGALNLEMPV